MMSTDNDKQYGFAFERLIEQMQLAKEQQDSQNPREEALAVEEIKENLRESQTQESLLLSLAKIVSLSHSRSWEEAFSGWDESFQSDIDARLLRLWSDECLVALALAGDLGVMKQVSNFLHHVTLGR